MIIENATYILNVTFKIWSMNFFLTDLASMIHELREFIQTKVLTLIRGIKQSFQENTLFRL